MLTVPTKRAWNDWEISTYSKRTSYVPNLHDNHFDDVNMFSSSNCRRDDLEAEREFGLIPVISRFQMFVRSCGVSFHIHESQENTWSGHLNEDLGQSPLYSVIP